MGVATPPPLLPPRRLTARQRQRLTRGVAYALTAVVAVLIAIGADWGKLAETFADAEIFSDLFPEIVTVAAKNTIVLALLAFAGGLLLGLVLALMRLSSVRF